MKILLIDTYVHDGGHNREYMENIILPGHQYVLLLGMKNDSLGHKQYIFKENKFSPMLRDSIRNINNPFIRNFFRLIFFFIRIYDWSKITRLTNKIISVEKPRICHFLNGDIIFKSTIRGMISIRKNCKTVLTFHHVNDLSAIQKFRRKKVFRKISIGVVHTSTIFEILREKKIFNIAHIEYPCFGGKSRLNSLQAKEYWNVPANIPVLLSAGGTRSEKGLDILLQALRNVSAPFYLLIAGKENDIKEEYINRVIAPYKDNVKVYLRILTAEEFKNAFMAADFIVLPYRKSFQGASGPLTEGVMAKKVIIGSSFGSVGEIIRKNHLGYTFESEDAGDLASVLNHALTGKFQYNDTAEKYAESLDPAYFQRKYADLYDSL